MAQGIHILKKMDTNIALENNPLPTLENTSSLNRPNPPLNAAVQVEETVPENTEKPWDESGTNVEKQIKVAQVKANLAKPKPKPKVTYKNDSIKAPNKEVIEGLECIHEKLELEEPLVITSGTRSKEANKETGGAKCSQHLFGDAVDIRRPSDLKKGVLEKTAKECGFTTTIGEYSDGHLHIDMGPENKQERADQCKEKEE